MECLLEKIVLKIYQSIDKDNSCEEKIEILQKINYLYQIIYENDDYGASYEILSLVNYHISHLYKELNNNEKYEQYYNYYKDFKLEFEKVDKNYKHTSLLLKNKNIGVNRNIIEQIKKYESKIIKNTIS